MLQFTVLRYEYSYEYSDVSLTFNCCVILNFLNELQLSITFAAHIVLNCWNITEHCLCDIIVTVGYKFTM